MTAFKRCCALVLSLVMLLAIIPGTAFAAPDTAIHAELTPMEETSLADIASDVAKQVLRSSREKDEKIEVETTPRYDENDEVEIIVVVSNDTAAPEAAAQIQSLLKQQDKAVQKISKQAMSGSRVEPEHQYTTLFNGFSTTVTYGQYQKIRDLDCVESAFISPTFELVPATANSNRMIGGGIYNETGFNGEGMLIAILDTGVDMSHKIFSKDPTSPALSKADLKELLNTKKFQATDIVSGLSAEDLYKSAKFPFQFDYGDKDKDGTPGEKGSHGTHVASTAAGCTGINDEVMGVAPEAQIVNMNVFKASGGASYSDILCALEDCIALGVDVANLSLGSDCGYIDYDTEDEWTKNLLNVFEKVGESGTSLAVAAGNAYSAAYGDAFGGKALASNPDYGLVSEPSTYGESLSVAAVSNGMVTGPFITVAGKDLAYQDSATISEDADAVAMRTLAKKGELEYVVVPGTGTEDDFAQVDAAGKIALVERGGIYYQKKMDNAYKAGAIGMLVYNNTEGMLYMSIENWEMPSAFISQAAGEYMKKQENKVLTVSAFDDVVEAPVTGMADFSSWGATPELTLKPEITAPGAGIYAAVPGNSYESMDGTSMASPHVAGGMAIVQQALKARGITDAAERKHLTDTLLMSTAHIITNADGVPYSPRKQGAGLMSIANAVNTKGYITVEGQQRPKLELKDDPEKTGRYTMKFTVHNSGEENLYYDIKPIVLTDKAGTYTNGSNVDYTVTTETSTPLSHTFTTNCTNNRVLVEAGKTADVTVIVTLTNPEEMAEFTNGAYVEGWVTLKQVDKDGGELTDPIDLGVPFLAFYGDWTVAPIMDSTDYWETLDGSASEAQAYMNTAFTTSSENTVDTYLGDNNYENVPYFADHNAISPNEDDFMDSLYGIYTGLLRNTKSLKYTITGANGEVYYSKDCEYVGKSIYSYDYYRITPAGVDAEYDGIEPWYGTDAHNSKLPNNTKATVRIEAMLAYGDGGSKNLKNSWEFPITIDTEEPEAKNLKVTEAEGRYYLSLDVADNQYVAAVIFYNLKNSSLLYGKQGFSETTPGATSHIKEFDVTGMGERFGMIVHDYAGNSKSYVVSVPGNSDDYGDIVPTDILWTENFNGDWLPEGWSVESKGGSVNTWYRGEEYTASIDYDDDNQQNEWLYSIPTDLSQVETEAHMIFDFYTTYWYTVEYKHCNLLVMASADGENWEEIWNLQRDSGLFTAWTRTQAKVTIPEKFQNCSNLRFAFVYTGKGGSNLDLDNVQVYADERENYIAVNASAGEGGSISPEGVVLVKKGTSKTFQIAANEGYEVENVQVDGVDVGPVGYYTFERVGVDHTISATFRRAVEGGELAIFNNDFNDTTAFPGQGWTVKNTNGTGKYYNWHQSRNTNVSTGLDDKQAIVDPDEYYDTAVGDKQDEHLISPAVDLSGKEATLSFNYGFTRTALYNGKMTFTVEASTDGGKTWTAIWNAKDDVANGSGSVQTGLAEIAVPETYQTANVQFAFHYYKTAYTGAGTVIVDNAKLTAPAASSETCVLTTVASEGGTVQPAGQTQLAPGETVKVTFEPDEGYQLASVKVNGRSVDVTDGAYTLTMDQNYAVTAEFEVIPDVPQVMFENDFESVSGDSFPFHGWTLKGKNTNGYTWKQQTYWNWKDVNDTKHAYISDDWHGGEQDEYLISPAVDLSGTRSIVLSFDYGVGYYGPQNKTYTATVEVSTDGGQTWTALWDFFDVYNGEKTGVISGTKELAIPEQYAMSGVQFAFHYVNPTHNTGPMAVDNVKLLAVQDGSAGTQYTITATAGEGGTITPSGEVSVKEGASQSFVIAANTGYEIADVLVDGESAGAVDSYTFENVTAVHTISASFRKTAAEVEFDNDFEQDDFPGHGWTVQSENTGCTWYVGTNRNLNTTRQARIDFDYYEDDGGWGWGYTDIQPMAAGTGKKQNEYLVSPAVDLTDKTPTLSFDYLLFKYMIQNSIAKFTVEASTDGGSTWTTIWNAADLEAVSGYYFKGTAEIAVPEAYRTANVQFAFHFYKTNSSYTDSDGMFAIDNVKLTYGQTDPCAGGHTLEAIAEVPATCTEDGVEAFWKCAVCSKLFSDAEGTNEIKAPVVISAKGHQLEHVDGVPATCTESGTQEYWKCSACGKLFSDEKAANEIKTPVVIPAKGHNMEGVAEVPATCTEPGTKAYWKCLNCGKLFTDSEGTNEITEPETIPAKGHSLEAVAEVPATCTEEGTEAYWKCTACGKLFSDEKGETEIKMPIVIPAKGHTLVEIEKVEASCTENGTEAYWKCTACGKLFSDAEGKNEITAPIVITANGHTLEKTEKVEATCTEPGKLEFWTCTACGKIFSDENGKHEVKPIDLMIPAKGHTLSKTEKVEATCTEDGTEAYWKCSACGKLFSDEKGETEIKAPVVIPAKGHTHSKTEKVEASCTEEGTEAYWKCSACGKLFSDEKGETEIKAPVVIPAKGHTLSKTEKVEATCTEDGTEAYWKCSACGKLFSDEKGETEIKTPVVIPANGHDFTVKIVSEETLRSAATYAEKATYWYTCSVCGVLSDTAYFEAGEVVAHQISGDESWTKGSNDGAKITADDASVTGVMIDGKVLSENDYVLDGTTITLKPETLEKLTDDEHTVTVAFENGTAGLTLTVKAAPVTPTDPVKPNDPKTGDSTNVVLLSCMAVVALATLAALAFVLVKRKDS